MVIIVERVKAFFFFRNCSLAQHQSMERDEKELLSEGKEEREVHNVHKEKEELNKVKKNKKEDNEGVIEGSCLWSLTTDAGISRHTTVFTLGIPVRSNIFTQTIENQ